MSEQPSSNERCINWPCAMRKGHVGPCSTSPEQRSSNELCHAHEIKEVPRYGIPGTIWDKKNCPYCKIERLQAQINELLAALRNALPVLEFEIETRGSNDLLYEIPAGPVLDAARAAIAKAEGRSR